MKNKRLEKKIEKYCDSTTFPFKVYFTDSPFNLGGYEGYRYFFCYHGTNNIAAAFKSQREVEEFINEKEYELIEEY